MQVGVLKLYVSLGEFGCSSSHALFQFALLCVQLLVHLAYATEHTIELRGEQSYLILRSKRNFDVESALFGFRHRKQNPVNRLIYQIAEKEIGSKGDRDYRK